MPFDGNGNWTSNFNAEADRDAGYKILASRFDNILLADIAQSFENCLTKDTQIKPQTNFNANNYRIINLANPEDDNDAMTYGKFRTGNNTVSGETTFSNRNYFTYGSDNSYRGFCYKDSSNNLNIGLNNQDGSSWQNYIRFLTNGSISFTATNVNGVTPSSATDNSTKLATTAWVQSWANTSNADCLAQWSKGTNGYFKFKNGLIIQWGSYSNSGSYNLTFPTPFSSTTSYGIAAISLTSGNYPVITSKTKTGCTILNGTNTSSWIAIGY